MNNSSMTYNLKFKRNVKKFDINYLGNQNVEASTIWILCQQAKYNCYSPIYFYPLPRNHNYIPETSKSSSIPI